MPIPRFPWPDQLLKSSFHEWVKEVSALEGIPELLRSEVRRQGALTSWNSSEVLGWRARQFAKYSDVSDVIGKPSIPPERAELACAVLSPEGFDPTRDCVHCLARLESSAVLQDHLQRNCPYFGPFPG